MGLLGEAISKMGCALSELASQKFPGGTPKRKLTKHGSIASKDMSDEHFSHDQKDLLRNTWEVLSENQQQHGEAIFQRIFATKAETKQLFPFRDLEGEELLKNPLFRSHSRRFMHAIEHTIHHLDSLDLILVPVLHRLGERHVKIPGFKLDYLSIFIQSMLHVFGDALGKKFTPEIRSAWQHLGKFIAGKMIEGYQSGLMSMGKYLASQCLDNVMSTIGGNAEKPAASPCSDSAKVSAGDNTGKDSCHPDANGGQTHARTCKVDENIRKTDDEINQTICNTGQTEICPIDAKIDQTDDKIGQTGDNTVQTDANVKETNDKSGKTDACFNHTSNHVQCDVSDPVQ